MTARRHSDSDSGDEVGQKRGLCTVLNIPGIMLKSTVALRRNDVKQEEGKRNQPVTSPAHHSAITPNASGALHSIMMVRGARTVIGF